MGVQSPSTLATEGFGIVRKEGLSFPVRALTINASIVSRFETLPLVSLAI